LQLSGGNELARDPLCRLYADIELHDESRAGSTTVDVKILEYFKKTEPQSWKDYLTSSK